jgi:DNA modification methylase
MTKIAGQSSLLSKATHHKLIIGDCLKVLPNIPTRSIALVVTSPPYYNAPFDYQGMFKDYGEYLRLVESVARESYRVLASGRVMILNIDDMLVNGEKFPIVADATRIFVDVGFRYRDRIVWKKPDGS